MITVLPTPALERVRREILGCRRCPRLVAHRTGLGGPASRPVPGFGDPSATIMVLGMATTARGNPHGRPFTGNASASFLVAALHRAGLADRPQSEYADDGLTLRGAWMASAVRCPPPQHRPAAAERAACSEHLRAEWAALERLRVVVALGVQAWDAVLRTAGVPGPPRFEHGAEVSLGQDRTLVGSYHPSPQNTRPGLLTAAMLDGVLARACAAVDELPEGGHR